MMPGKLSTSASTILYLIKKSSFKSSQSWINWRETVLSVYENDEQAGKINAEINSGKINSKRIQDLSDVVELIENIQEQDKTSVLALLELYRLIYENSADFIPRSFNLNLFNEIAREISDDPDVRKTAVQMAETWLKLKKENRFYTNIYVPASIKPVLFDFMMRCVVLWFFQNFDWNALTNDNELTIFLFIVIQVVIIPVTILVFAVYNDRKIIQLTHSLISKIDLDDIRIKIKNTAWHYLLLFLMVVFSVTIMILVKKLRIPAMTGFVLSLVYGIYLLILQANFSKRIPSYSDIKKQIDENEKRDISGELSPEQNDEEIINLEVNLKSENERLNSYVIEAALFGALSFTGYLDLVSAGSFTYQNISQFNAHVLNILSYLFDSPVSDIADSSAYLLSKNGILTLISYQTLFCSIFFLAVIASRLRFSKLADAINRFLQLSKAMNDKEEIYLQNDKDNTTAIHYYNKKIKELLKEGYKKQAELMPSMEYMQFFRTLGIVMFFTIIITGGLLISPWISLILVFISSLSMFYFYIAKFKTALKSIYISLQEFYYRVETKIHWLCWSMIIVALLLRTFALPFGGPIMFFGFLFLFVHYLMNLIIPVQLDYEIKNNQDVFGTTFRYHLILATIFKISLALLFLGYLLKIMHWPNATFVVIASIMMMSAYFLIVKKFKRGSSMLEYFLGISIATVLLGTMFKLNHWPGTSIFIYIGIPLIYLSGIVVFIKQKQVRPLITRTVLILCVFSLMSFSGYFASAVMNLSFNYSAYQKIQKERKYYSDFYAGMDQLISSREIGSDSLKTIIDRFNKNFVFVEEPRYGILNELAWNVYLNSDDSLLLHHALIWSELTIEAEERWDWLDTYAALLYKNKRYDEARIYAEKSYKAGNDPVTKKLIQRIDSVLNR